MGTMTDEIKVREQLTSPKDLIQRLNQDDRNALVQGGTLPETMSERLKSLGLIYVTRSYWWLTEFGDYIKEMIVNKREMTIGEAEAFKAGVEETKALALKAVDDEAELLGDPGPRAALRGTVVVTKHGIRERIKKIGC